jgi:hypothetical protein
LNIPGLLGLLAAGLVLGIGIMVAWTATVLARPPRRTYASSLAKGRGPSTRGRSTARA